MKPVETYTLGQLQYHDFLTEEIYKNSFPFTSVPTSAVKTQANAVWGAESGWVGWETANALERKINFLSSPFDQDNVSADMCTLP